MMRILPAHPSVQKRRATVGHQAILFRPDWVLWRYSMRHRWHKWAAIFVLLWTVLDLSVPSLCAADNQLPVPPTLSSYASQVLPGNNTDGQRLLDTCEDDCFCCSSHVTPAPGFTLLIGSEGTPVMAVAEVRHPQDRPSSIYHPPRS